MSELDKPRTRWVNWTGGLNTQEEPYLIAENEYANGNNIVLESGVPETRLGSAKFDATNKGAAAIKGLGEYLFYDYDGTLTRYLLAVEGTNLMCWKNEGSSWSWVGNIYTLFTTGLWTSICTFKNKALITNGTDLPREVTVKRQRGA